MENQSDGTASKVKEKENQEEDSSTFLKSESQQSNIKVDLFSYFRGRSYWEMITVGWISKVMDYTREHELKLDDFGTVKETDSSKVHSNALKKKWKEITSENKTNPLLRSMFSLYKWNIITTLIIAYL